MHSQATTTSYYLLVNSTAGLDNSTTTTEPNTLFHKCTVTGLLLGGFLSIFLLLTVSGNSLVILAVLRERYLRNITNYFIVSLAIADLLMGTVVMPFAVLLNITGGYWPFGQLWCDLWHAIDVLSSTASILNLCMIALERFWATQNPIMYTTRMTKNRCVGMVALVWICSSCISFPAIIWWRMVQTEPPGNTCTFTDNSGYLISSSLVSFYGPLVVMLVVYYRIYLTATNLIKSLNAGTKVIYKNGQQGDVIVLRIHRGGGDARSHNNNQTLLPCSRAGSTSNLRESVSMQNLNNCMRHMTCKICNHNNKMENNLLLPPSSHMKCQHCNHNEFNESHRPSLAPMPNGLLSCSPKTTNNITPPSLNPPLYQKRSNSSAGLLLPSNNVSGVDNNRRCSFQPDREHHRVDDDGDEHAESTSGRTTSASRSIACKLRHFALGKKLTKFAREQKAAKTLGIVMGIFIVCWLPFFVCNIIVALDKELINPVIIEIVTWLGYINSGINPIIYAHSMRDFRRAFLKLLCCSKCGRNHVEIVGRYTPEVTVNTAARANVSGVLN